MAAVQRIEEADTPRPARPGDEVILKKVNDRVFFGFAKGKLKNAAAYIPLGTELVLQKGSELFYFEPLAHTSRQIMEAGLRFCGIQLNKDEKPRAALKAGGRVYPLDNFAPGSVFHVGFIR